MSGGIERGHREEDPVSDLEAARSGIDRALYHLSQNILYAEDEEKLSGTGWIGVTALPMRVIQEVALILDRMSPKEASIVAREKWGDTIEDVRVQARKQIAEFERDVGNRLLNLSTADDLVDILKEARDINITVEELVKTMDSSTHDPARAQLLGYLPGTEEEIKQVLSRRRKPADRGEQ